MNPTLASTTPRPVELSGTDRLVERISAARLAADGQYVVSQDRFVDDLLDLWNLCPSVRLRDLVGDALAEVRHLSSVRGVDAVSFLDEVLGAALVEGALDGVDLFALMAEVPQSA